MRFVFVTCLCLLCLLCFLGALSSLPSQAAEFSGRYLLKVCDRDAEGKPLVPGGHTACQAYIAGLIDYHNTIKALKTAPGLDFCIPEKTPLSTLQMVVLKYLKKNGQHDHFIASPAIAVALHQVYPCKRNKKTK